MFWVRNIFFGIFGFLAITQPKNNVRRHQPIKQTPQICDIPPDMFSSYFLPSHTVGQFSVFIGEKENKITVTHINQPKRILFSTRGDFLRIISSTPPNLLDKMIINGNYNLSWSYCRTPTDKLRFHNIVYSVRDDICHNDLEEKGEQKKGEQKLFIYGTVFTEQNGVVIETHNYRFSFFPKLNSKRQLGFRLELLFYNPEINHPPIILFSYMSNVKENFYGFGTQFTHWNLKGQRVPIVVSEQGVGRGKQPISFFVNAFEKFSSGDTTTSYSPQPLYITNFHNSVVYENHEPMFFDLRTPQKITVEIVGGHVLLGNIIYASSLPEIITEITLITGRMVPLPRWTQTGAIVGLEGGTKVVRNLSKKLIKSGVVISAFWIQDWVDIKKTMEGDRLCWCWILERKYYPNWEQMVEEWKTQHNIRVLSYVNPYFSAFKNNTLRNEGLTRGYFIRTPTDNAPYEISSGTIKFNMLDIYNPDARRWMIDIIKNNMINKTGVSGWMSDFGEHLPFDAVFTNMSLSNRKLAKNTLHNRYPDEWTKLNNDAIREWNDEHNISINEIVFFTRSSRPQGATTPLFWLGDQTVSWDKYDGIKTVLHGFLSGGISGKSLSHSDIGGYTQFSSVLVRSPELLMRWIEISAFGSAVLRTHIGSSMSVYQSQIYDNPEILSFFSSMTRIFAFLADYRYKLMGEATLYGWPLMRPMAFYGEQYWNISNQYFFGNEFIVYPVLNPNTFYVSVVLPRPSYTTNSKWVHLWSGDEYNGGAFWVYSPVGRPPVFYRRGSHYGEQLFSFVHSKK